MWYRRFPRALQRLIAAQCAIQLGLIIPLSGLYFGHFSVAGILVNLAAIPLIGVFVQAGLLFGLLDLIPVAGGALAWVPEQIAIVSGRLFFEIAHVGAGIFPYPEVPPISPALLPLYYLGLLALVRGREITRALRESLRRFTAQLAAPRYEHPFLVH